MTDEFRDLDYTVSADRKEALAHIMQGGTVEDPDSASDWDPDFQPVEPAWSDDGENFPDWDDDDDGWDDEGEDPADLEDQHRQAAQDFKKHALELARDEGIELSRRDLEVLLEESARGGFNPTATEIAFSQMVRARDDQLREAMATAVGAKARANARKQYMTRIANRGQDG